MPPNPDAIIPAKGDLLSALPNSPEDPEFDLEQWQRPWSAVETEMQAVTRQNSVAEGPRLNGSLFTGYQPRFTTCNAISSFTGTCADRDFAAVPQLRTENWI